MTDDYLFDAELVGNILLKLKRGKAAGIDQLTAEHLLYCHSVLPCILSKLFNLILRSGHVPCEFGHSYTVPLLKSNDSRVKSLTTDDFRGISISPIISKVFEHCVLNRFEKFFCTNANQFGFKKGVSCSNAIYNVRMTIDRYINCGSTVNLCAVDLSKAFDKVNHNALLIKLMNRELPVELLDTLAHLLSNCWSCVKWKSSMSSAFKIDFGVRQGSVLSPHLFAILLDDMVAHLTFRNKTLITLYADDILLLAPSVSELQRLLCMCERELQWLDLCINVKKSCCMRIGPRHDIICCNIVTSSGLALPWVDEIRYLGVFIISSRRFKCSLSYSKRSFYRSVNAILGKVLSTATTDVILHLINSKCVPILLYGLEVCPLSKADLQSLDFCVNRLLMKLFNTNNLSLVTECRQYFSFALPSELLDKRTIKFLRKLEADCM